jgi:hypothetical protein
VLEDGQKESWLYIHFSFILVVYSLESHKIVIGFLQQIFVHPPVAPKKTGFPHLLYADFGQIVDYPPVEGHQHPDSE